MWAAITEVEKNHYDRIIVITDEQTMGSPHNAKIKNAYMINVASYSKGVGYGNNYKHINGFSDKVFNYISEIENV